VGRGGSVSWLVRVRIGSEYRTKTFRQKADAECWGGKTEDALRDGVRLPVARSGGELWTT
jgi:hypothetical protein